MKTSQQNPSEVDCPICGCGKLTAVDSLSADERVVREHFGIPVVAHSREVGQEPALYLSPQSLATLRETLTLVGAEDVRALEEEETNMT